MLPVLSASKLEMFMSVVVSECFDDTRGEDGSAGLLLPCAGIASSQVRSFRLTSL